MGADLELIRSTYERSSDNGRNLLTHAKRA